MIRIFAAAVAVTLLAGPAAAQKMLNEKSDPHQAENDLKRKSAADVDAQYRAAVKRMNEPANAKNDPWANMRGNDQPGVSSSKTTKR